MGEKAVILIHPEETAHYPFQSFPEMTQENIKTLL
jgi:hypothetical protein